MEAIRRNLMTTPLDTPVDVQGRRVCWYGTCGHLRSPDQRARAPKLVPHLRKLLHLVQVQSLEISLICLEISRKFSKLKAPE